MSAPRVTVLMPVFNAAKYVREAIESILDQTFDDFEFLIIDDGSTDATPSVIRSFHDPRIRVRRHEQNLGLVATLNEGLHLAKADLVARMDADDISHPDRLEKQLALVDGNPDVVLVGSDVDIIDQNGKTISYEPKPTDPDAIRLILSVICPIAHSTVLFRKESVLKIGGYANLYVAEDYELWTRLADEGDLSNLPLPLLKYRINPEGESLRKTDLQVASSRIIRDREWRKYDRNGPAPLEKWPQIWPVRGSLGKARPNEFRFYSDLHRHFARCYSERGAWKLALQHALAAASWILSVKSIIAYTQAARTRKA